MPDAADIVLAVRLRGALVLPTLRAAALAVRTARGAGAQARLHVVADEGEALEAVERFVAEKPHRSLHVPKDADAAARWRDAVLEEGATHVAWLDDTALPSPNWLRAAWHRCGTEAVTVWHPATAFVFGGGGLPTLARPQPDSTDPSFDPAGLAVANPWTGFGFAPAALWRRLALSPEPADPAARAAAMWSGHARALALGVAQRPVPGTALFVRRGRKAGPAGPFGDDATGDHLPELAPLLQALARSRPGRTLDAALDAGGRTVEPARNHPALSSDP